MTPVVWALIATGILLLGIAVGKFLQLLDLMELYRADLDGDEIDGGWLFDAPYPRTRNNAAGEKGEGQEIRSNHVKGL